MIRIAAVTIAVLSLAAGACQCQTNPTALTYCPPRLITVSGEAQLNVVPDEIVVSIGTQACGETASEAKAANDEIATRVIGLSKELGIDPQKVQTDALEIDLVKPEFRDWRACYDSNETRNYGARQMIKFTLNDVKKLEPLLTRALEEGAVKILGVDFQTTELRRYRDEARAKALRAAKEKARDMAAELGQKIGRPYTISEDRYYGAPNWHYYGYWWRNGYGGHTANTVQNITNAAGESLDGAIALGQIAVIGRVTVSFELR